jgi:hypothetical protein
MARGRWLVLIALGVMAAGLGAGRAVLAEAQATTVAPAPTTPATAAVGDNASSRTVNRIIAALIGLGALLGIVTIAYWWITRPPRGAPVVPTEASPPRPEPVALAEPTPPAVDSDPSPVPVPSTPDTELATEH